MNAFRRKFSAAIAILSFQLEAPGDCHYVGYRNNMH